MIYSIINSQVYIGTNTCINFYRYIINDFGQLPANSFIFGCEKKSIIDSRPQYVQKISQNKFIDFLLCLF